MKNEVELRISQSTKVEMAYSPCGKFSSRRAWWFSAHYSCKCASSLVRSCTLSNQSSFTI